MATTLPCPPVERLRELLGGQGASGGQTDLVHHLGHCVPCQQALEQLAGADPALLKAVLACRNQGFETEAPLRQALSNIENNSTLNELSEFRDRSTWIQSFLKPTQFKGALGRLDDFEVTQLIGQGGMGLVFKAFEPSLNRHVALKILAPDLASDPVARERFAREAKAAAAIKHEHVVTIHSVNDGNGLPYIVMEFVDGGSLQEYLDIHGPPDWQTITRIGAEVASGLAAAHAGGLVHRDIKPSNILLQVDSTGQSLGVSKITDFGVARIADESRLTVSGIIPGTPMYMAPEQALCEPIDERCDQFSLGSVLYTLCAGREPFTGGSPIAVLKQVVEAYPQPIRELNASIPVWLEETVERLQAKRPSDRFGSAAEVADLLTYNLQHPDQPRSFPLVRKIKQRWTRRRLLVATSLAGILLVLLVVLGKSLMGDPANGVTRRAILSAHDGAVRSVAFAPDGSRLASGSDDATLRFWNPQTGQLMETIDKLNEPVWSIAYAHSGKFLISGDSNGPILVWEVPSLKPLPSLPHTSGSGRRVVISPDDKIIAVSNGTQVVELLDFEKRALKQTLPGHGGIIQSMAFSPAESLLATGDANGAIRFFDLENGTELPEIQAAALGLRALAFSADGKLLASAGTVDKDVKVWDVATRQLVGTLSGYENEVLTLAFSPDGRFLASGGRDGQVRIWDPSTFHPLSTLKAHQTSVSSIAFSPDSQTLASGGDDKKVMLWDLTAIRIHPS